MLFVGWLTVGDLVGAGLMVGNPVCDFAVGLAVELFVGLVVGMGLYTAVLEGTAVLSGDFVGPTVGDGLVVGLPVGARFSAPVGDTAAEQVSWMGPSNDT